MATPSEGGAPGYAKQTAAFNKARDTIMTASLNRRQAAGIRERIRKAGLITELSEYHWDEFFATLPDPPEPKAPELTTELWSPASLVAADIPEPEAFLGEDVASRSSVVLFAGRRGAGKTYVLLRLAASVALGIPFGDLSCRPGRVLFLSQEMGKASIRKRIKRLFSPEEQAELEAKLDISCKLPWKLDSDDALTPLIALLSSNPYDLVIVDALRDVKGSIKENDNDQMGEGFVRLRDRICERFNLCLLMNHHKGKPNAEGIDRGGRGASTIEDVVADIVYVTKTSEGRYLDFEKTRDGATEGKRLAFTIAEDPDDSTRICLDVSEAESVSDTTFELNKLYSTLQQDGSSLFALDDITRLMSWAPRTARTHLASAKAAGRLINTTTKPAKALYRYIPLERRGTLD